MKLLIRGMLTHLKLLQIARQDALPALLHLLRGAYPQEIPAAAQARLLAYIEQESQLFERTLAAGYRRMRQIAQSQSIPALSGRQTLEFEKRHGIPLPLIQAEISLPSAKVRHRWLPLLSTCSPRRWQGRQHG